MHLRTWQYNLLNAVRIWLCNLPSTREGFRRRDLRGAEIGFALRLVAGGSGDDLFVSGWVLVLSGGDRFVFLLLAVGFFCPW